MKPLDRKETMQTGEKMKNAAAATDMAMGSEVTATKQPLTPWYLSRIGHSTRCPDGRQTTFEEAFSEGVQIRKVVL